MVVGYPGAIWIPADPSNYYLPQNHNGIKNNPLCWVLHTPEEPADNIEVTPSYFQTPGIEASTHYYLDNDGDIYQMVSEENAAIANGVKGRPYPSWASTSTSLNWQSLNVEIEGYADSIQDTLIIGGPQWKSLLSLIKNRASVYNIPLDREHIIGHYQVASDRVDPGSGFPWDALICDLQGGDDMFNRFNGITPLSGKTYMVGKDWFVSLWVDFPKLPKTAKLVELDVRIDPSTPGEVLFKDGTNKAYADVVNRYKPQTIIKVIPGADGRVFFDINNAAVKFTVLGIVGYWS